MITVGSVYMRVSGEAFKESSPIQEAVTSDNQPNLPPSAIAPSKEIMKDMLEMSRGVQHATRGLFLRYYMSGLTRDYLPNGNEG
jgi:vacuolar protein sorting-associated protein 35